MSLYGPYLELSISRQPLFHGPEGIRTLGLCVANAALSQLSYEPISQKNPRKMEATGLEPMTFRV